jgi:hypothetical protein
MAVTAARAGPNNFSPNLERDARSVCSEVLGLSVRNYQKRYQWTESSPHRYFALSEAAILTQRPVAWLLPTAAAVGIGGEALGSGIGHRSLARRHHHPTREMLDDAYPFTQPTIGRVRS